MLRSFRKNKSVFTDRKSPRKLAKKVVEELRVKTPSLETPVRKLSGGNVQKVLVGREIASAPKVLLTAYAVRGLDINSSHTIYDLINQQKQKGVEHTDAPRIKITTIFAGSVNGIKTLQKAEYTPAGRPQRSDGRQRDHRTGGVLIGAEDNTLCSRQQCLRDQVFQSTGESVNRNAGVTQ